MISKLTFVSIVSIFACAFGPCNRYLGDVTGKVVYYCTSDSSCYYITLGKDTVQLSGIEKTIEFSGGKDSLRAFIDHYYYSNVKKDSLYQELNHIVSVGILIDPSMRVVETRLLRRTYDKKKSPKLDSIFLSAMRKTEGHWRVINGDSNDYHFEIVVYRIY